MSAGEWLGTGVTVVALVSFLAVFLDGLLWDDE